MDIFGNSDKIFLEYFCSGEPCEDHYRVALRIDGLPGNLLPFYREGPPSDLEETENGLKAVQNALDPEEDIPVAEAVTARVPKEPVNREEEYANNLVDGLLDNNSLERIGSYTDRERRFEIFSKGDLELVERSEIFLHYRTRSDEL